MLTYWVYEKQGLVHTWCNLAWKVRVGWEGRWIKIRIVRWWTSGWKRTRGRIRWKTGLIWTWRLERSGRWTARRWEIIIKVGRVRTRTVIKSWGRKLVTRNPLRWTVGIESYWCGRSGRRWWMRVVRWGTRSWGTTAGCGTALWSKWTTSGWNASTCWVAPSSTALSTVKCTRLQPIMSYFVEHINGHYNKHLISVRRSWGGKWGSCLVIGGGRERPSAPSCGVASRCARWDDRLGPQARSSRGSESSLWRLQLWAIKSTGERSIILFPFSTTCFFHPCLHITMVFVHRKK